MHDLYAVCLSAWECCVWTLIYLHRKNVCVYIWPRIDLMDNILMSHEYYKVIIPLWLSFNGWCLCNFCKCLIICRGESYKINELFVKLRKISLFIFVMISLNVKVPIWFHVKFQDLLSLERGSGFAYERGIICNLC